MPRRALLHGAVAVLLLIAAGLAAAGARQLASPIDPLAAEAAQPRHFPDSPGYGVNADLFGADDARLRADLAAIRAAGFRSVRQRIPWARVEPAPGVEVWDATDRLLAAARAEGLTVLAVVVEAPAWSRPSDPSPFAPPDDPSALARFAARLAERHGAGLAGVEVWDEPNIAPHWGERAIDPTGYARLLRAVSEAVRTVRPGLPIVVAGLAPNVEAGGLNLSDLGFLDALYRAGAAPYFDAVAAKPYGFWTGAEDAPDPETLNFARVALLREVMLSHGDAEHPIWAVEFGWNALPEAWTGPESPWGSIDEATQAVETRRAIEHARAAWPWLTVLYLPDWRPTGPPDDPHRGFALVGDDGSSRPVLRAVATAIHETPLGPGVHPLSQLAGPFPTDPTSPAPTASPPLPSQRERGQGGEGLPFTGTAVALELPSEPAVSLAWSIDGRPAGALDLPPAPRSAPPSPPASRVGDCTGCAPATAAGRRRVVLAQGLPDGTHRLDLRLSPAPTESAALVVSRELPPDPVAPVRAGLVALALTLALAGLASLAGAVRLLDPSTYTRRLSGRLPGTEPVTAGGSAAMFDRRWLAVLAALSLAWYLAPAPWAWLPLIGWLALGVLRPVALLPVVVAFAPLAWLPKPLGLGAAALAPAEVLLLGLLAVTAGHVVLARAGGFVPAFRLPPFRPIDAAPLGFVALGLVASLAAEHGREAFREWRTVIVEPALFYYLCLGLVRTRRELLWLPAALVATSAILAVWGVGQYVFTTLDIEAEGVRRMRSLYPSPVNLGLLLGRAVPLTAAFALLGSRHRAPLLALTALLGVCLLLTFSLGAWLGAAAGLIVVLVALGRRGLLLAAAGAAGAILLLGLLAEIPRIGSHFTLAGETTTSRRLSLWWLSLRMALDHPWLGVGPDNFLYAYPAYVARYAGSLLPGAEREINFSHPHNLLLDFWLRLGLLGVPLLLVTVAAFFRRGTRLWRDLTSHAALVGVVAVMVDTLVHGLTDNSYFLPDLALFFWLCLAFVRLLSTCRFGSRGSGACGKLGHGDTQDR